MMPKAVVLLAAELMQKRVRQSALKHTQRSIASTAMLFVDKLIMKGLKHEELARLPKSHLPLLNSKSSMNSVDIPIFSLCKKKVAWRRKQL